jgi:hypothetical protein
VVEEEVDDARGDRNIKKEETRKTARAGKYSLESERALFYRWRWCGEVWRGAGQGVARTK